MEYCKLVALEIGDFSSSIFWEGNYALDCAAQAREKQRSLESEGYVCILMKLVSGIFS